MSKQPKLKAWAVCDFHAEIGLIVFAFRHGQARSYARQREGFDNSDWTDITATRLPDMDGKRDKPCVLDWDKDARLYWEAKYRPDTDQTESCAMCGRYEFEEIEESALLPVGNISICKTCALVEIARKA